MHEGFSLPQRLTAATAHLDDAVRACAHDRRVDVAGLPRGCLALVLARAASERAPLLVLTADTKGAQALAADVRFFLGEGERDGEGVSSRVLSYPAADTSAFVEVSPDRRAAMDRLATAWRIAQGLPWTICVAPAAAMLRRVAPHAVLTARTRCLRAGDTVDRDELIAQLVDAGYARVPLVEDPGGFAVRGALLDVFPPQSTAPARIEFDDDRIVAMRRFDADDQRARDRIDELWLCPARGVLVGAAELAHARERLSDLCDRINLPSARRRQLLDDLGAGRGLSALEGFLPAFYEWPETLFDYLPIAARVVVVDAQGVADAVAAELDGADRDRAARLEQHGPAFEVRELYVEPDEFATRLGERPLAVAHAIAVLGAPDPEVDDPIEHVLHAPNAPLRLVVEDQSGLATELRAQRAQPNQHDPLEPLVRRVRHWLDEGLRVVVSAHTRAQGERIASLLRGRDVPLAGAPAAFTLEVLRARPRGSVEIVLGGLTTGFVLPGDAIAFVTEEDVFGARVRRAAPRKKKDEHRAFIADLRELVVGDFVVHVEHGIGRYLGLARAELPVRRGEALMGMAPKRVEVLVVEYGGGDRLYLPVTRLDQLDKHSSADTVAPKLDRLGGNTFARTKARVRQAVKILADELLALYAARAARERPAYPPPDHLYAEFEAAFAHEETPDQMRSIDAVMEDLDAPRPMDRLVCGDVGFGKTEVALRAAFRVAMSGRQVALLCPTTVLAQQHLETFRRRLKPYPVRVEMLSRFVPKKVQTEVVHRLRDGTCDIVVGTHRLLSKDVHFKNLGLLVVDEEQRFGVGHKERIKKLRTEVDVLTLSATPIPRTLHMALGGLRELSLIATAPIDRRAVRTFVTRWDEHVIREAIERELARGGQVFFVHNRIDKLYDRAARLAELVPRARIATAHGQMRASALERIMTDFVAGKYDVLCSTAIIENGLDIPRANTILIDRADSYGLAQLYQLRGRVGRSHERAYCYLIAPPLGDLSDEARARIEALERFTQLGAGFSIASLDMELRGAGDLLGEAQSGNVAAVGLDLFVRMLEEAVAEVRGEPVVHDVDPELNINIEHYLPDDYIAEVGLRLSLYKRLAVAADEEAVQELAAEMEDRFGPPPPPAVQLVRVMSLKPALRALHALGCEATSERVALHLREDAPLDGDKVVAFVRGSRTWQLTPVPSPGHGGGIQGAGQFLVRTLVRRFAGEGGGDAVDRVLTVLRELALLRRVSP